MAKKSQKTRLVYYIMMAPKEFDGRSSANGCQEVAHTYNPKYIEQIVRAIPKEYNRFVFVEEEPIK